MNKKSEQPSGDHLAALQAKLQTLPIKPASSIEDSGDVLKIGQLWTTKFVNNGTPDNVVPKNGQHPSWFLIAIEDIGEGMFNAAPAFPWTEMALDDGLILDPYFFGHPMVVSLSMLCTVKKNMLAECLGRYDEVPKFVKSALVALDQPEKRDAFSWGLHLLDDHDTRIKYHDWIAETLELLQKELRQTLSYEEGVSAPTYREEAEASDNLIAFPASKLQKASHRLAASGAEDERASFLSSTYQIQDTECILLIDLDLVGKSIRLKIIPPLEGVYFQIHQEDQLAQKFNSLGELNMKLTWDPDQPHLFSLRKDGRVLRVKEI